MTYRTSKKSKIFYLLVCRTMISSMAFVKKRSKISPALVVAAASAESSCPKIKKFKYDKLIKC
jgi:hypothetical protein